jgi:anti-sigma B factor antagonist
MENLTISSTPGTLSGSMVFKLDGPLVIRDFFEFQRTMQEDHSKVTILDLGEVPYADSTGIGALVNAYVSRDKTGRKLALVNVTPRVMTVLKVTRVDQLFQFYPSVQAAEAALAGSTATNAD